VAAQVAGRYRLDTRIRPELDPGAWAATDEETERPVLVYLVSRDTGVAASRCRHLRHAGLVPVLDVVPMADGVAPPLDRVDPLGDTFVVLEALEGDILEEIVRLDGPLDALMAVRSMLTLAEALAAIHGAGAVHGGVTPLAIEVLALDEGHARLAFSGARGPALAYHSPPRIADGGASAADDTWGLLACLSFAVEGVAPVTPSSFRGASPAEQDLERIFERGFSADPTRRYPDAVAMRDVLRGWLAVHGASAVPDPEPPASPVASQSPVLPAVTEQPRPREAEHRAVPKASSRKLFIAFAAGGVFVAALLGLASRRSPSRWGRTVTPQTPAHAAPTIPTAAADVRAASSPSPVHPSATPASLPGALPPMSASAVASAAPPESQDVDACVAHWFPADAFDKDTDLAFVCDENDGRRGTSRLRRAIVAGGKGKKLTEGMREWSSYGWFELPVYATLRARCCSGAAPIDVPRVLGSTCTVPDRAIHELGIAAAEGAELAPPIRTYRKLVACLVEEGDSPAYGQSGPIGGAEETWFRALVARGRKP
jgi:hypothetical protein